MTRVKKLIEGTRNGYGGGDSFLYVIVLIEGIAEGDGSSVGRSIRGQSAGFLAVMLQD